MHCDQVFTLLGQLENATRAKVVDLEGVSQRVVEVDARCCVDDHVHFLLELSTHGWVNS